MPAWLAHIQSVSDNKEAAMKNLFMTIMCIAAAVGGCKEFDPANYDKIEIQCVSKTIDYRQKVIAVKQGDKLHLTFYDMNSIPSLQFSADYQQDSRFAKKFFKLLNPEKMIKMGDSTQMELTGGRYDYSVKLDNDENAFTLYSPCSLEVVIVPAKALGLMANTDKLFTELQNEAGRKNPKHNDDAPTP
ncbi:MAG TPA: hypothetical protein PKK48_06225 [Phycisphaerae bacterium]|nr:hypothetical protein [Phycisphaerae bacterium]HPS53012.1 hypothetical protein [Phycisphaerae bacterium]